MVKIKKAYEEILLCLEILMIGSFKRCFGFDAEAMGLPKRFILPVILQIVKITHRGIFLLHER